MATAKKLPSGRWRVQLYIGTDDSGKRLYKSFTADTKKEAEFLAAEYNLKRKEAPKGVTVGDAVDGYIANKENVLSPSSISGYRKIRRNWLQSLMDVQLDKLDAPTIQAAINLDAARISPKSLRCAWGLVYAAIKMHMPEFTATVTLPAKQHIIKELPTPGEVLQAVQGTEIELPVLMGMWFGMRLSEILGLKFSDISGNVITISRALLTVDGVQIERSNTKTYNSTRQVAAPPEIMEKLNAIPHKSEDERIFSFPPGGIYKRFQTALKKAGLPPMRFHDLRHMSASIMVALGIPNKYAQERGGWATDSTLKVVYQHTFSEERKAVDEKINDYFRAVLLTMQHEMQHDD